MSCFFAVRIPSVRETRDPRLFVVYQLFVELSVSLFFQELFSF